MQITLIESEIKQAIKLYLQDNIGLSEKKDIKVDFTATRGSEGLKASIDVLPEGHVEPEEQLAEATIQGYRPPKIEEYVDPLAPENIKKLAEAQRFDPNPKGKSLFANLTV